MATTPARIPCTQAEATASCSGAVESGCSGIARSEPAQASSTTNLGWSFCPLFLSKFINRFLFSFLVPLPHTIFFLDQKLPWVAFKKVTYFLQRFFPRSVLYPVLIMIGFVKKLYKRALIYLILVWIFRFQIKLVWIRVFFHFLFLAAMVSSTWLSLWWLFPISQAFW